MVWVVNLNSVNFQFFIMFVDGDWLNGQYIVFGEVVDGMNYVDNIVKGEFLVNLDKIIKMQVVVDVG